MASELDQVILKLGIDKILQQSVSQSTLDRLESEIRAKDVNNVLGAIDRAISGLGQVISPRTGTSPPLPGMDGLGEKTTLGGCPPAAPSPYAFVEGAMMLQPP